MFLLNNPGRISLSSDILGSRPPLSYAILFKKLLFLCIFGNTAWQWPPRSPRTARIKDSNTQRVKVFMVVRSVRTDSRTLAVIEVVNEKTNEHRNWWWWALSGTKLIVELSERGKFFRTGVSSPFWICCEAFGFFLTSRWRRMWWVIGGAFNTLTCARYSWDCCGSLWSNFGDFSTNNGDYSTGKQNFFNH